MPAPGPRSLGAALIPIVSTLVLIAVQIFIFRDFNPQAPLALGVAITALFGWRWGFSWKEMEDGLFRIIVLALPVFIILLLIGMIVGAWIAGGTVPLLVYYGLKLLDPRFFLPAALLCCSAVSLALGTSWGTMATVGIALMGIGESFGYPLYLTAGAVISGAFFGDKMSPLSETTNLAPALNGVSLYDHIKNMVPTALPSMILSLALFTFIGWSLANAISTTDNTANIMTAMETNFTLSNWALLPPAVVLVLALFRIPPIPALFSGVAAGALCAVVLQGAGLHDIFVYFQDGYTLKSGNALIDKLFSRGGFISMTWLLTLFLTALCFGGVLEKTGCLNLLSQRVMARVRSFKVLQISSILSAVSIILLTGESCLSLVLPSRMYRKKYKQLGYSALNLSRAVEEGGTLVAPLVPWCASGAFAISVLGLHTADGGIEWLYIPFSFGCWISPLLGMLYATLGIFSPKLEPDSAEREMEWEQARQAGSDPTADLNQPVRNFLKWYDPEHSLFLSSPFQGLAKGVNTHNLPLKETKRRGDLGMGVLSQDAGHFIILDNELFYLDPSGQVAPPPDQAMVSFSGATYFQPQTEESISSPVEHPPMLELLPRLIPSNNLIYALRIDGDFRNLALAGGETLAQASGTVVGFYIPAFLKGAAGDGFALGFIDRDRKRGGRILRAEIVDIKVSIMQVTKLEMCLPLTMDYLTADL